MVDREGMREGEREQWDDGEGGNKGGREQGKGGRKR